MILKNFNPGQVLGQGTVLCPSTCPRPAVERRDWHE